MFFFWKTNRKITLGLIMLLLMMQISASALAAADRKPPGIQVTPKHGETDVPVSTSIVVTFSEQVKLPDGSAITSKKAASLFDFTKMGSGERIEAGISWSSQKKKLTITPKKPLDYGTMYRINFPANKVKDRVGNPNQKQDVQFRTEELGPPLMAKILPAHGAQNVPVDTSIRIIFNKPVTRANHQQLSNGAVDKIVKLVDEKGKRVPFHGKWEEKQRTAIVDPEGNLADGVTYTVTLLENKVMDRQGIKNSAVLHQFTTRKQQDTIAPAASFQPGHGATKVPTDVKLTLVFAEEITHLDGTPLASKTVGQMVQLYNEQGKEIACRVTWNKSKRTLSITPKGKLQPNTTYTLNLPAGSVKDLSGNANKAGKSVFTTGRN